MLSALERPSYLSVIPRLRLEELQTGDLVLFSGRTVSARLVQLCTGSYWSHVGVVLRLPEYGDAPLLWEATRASKLADISRGVVGDGVQLVPLAEKLASYPGEAVVRRLAGVETACWRRQRIRPLLRQWGSRPYCNFVIKQARAWWRGHEADSWQRGGFCSEFVAEIYKHWRLLPAHTPSINYVPRDFSPEGRLPLLRGWLMPAGRLPS